VILADLDEDMPVEPASDCGITARTVGTLRQLTMLPSFGIRVTISRARFPESPVKIGKE
jgi:hypothetical protein